MMNEVLVRSHVARLVSVKCCNILGALERLTLNYTPYIHYHKSIRTICTFLA